MYFFPLSSKKSVFSSLMEGTSTFHPMALFRAHQSLFLYQSSSSYLYICLSTMYIQTLCISFCGSRETSLCPVFPLVPHLSQPGTVVFWHSVYSFIQLHHWGCPLHVGQHHRCISHINLIMTLPWGNWSLKTLINLPKVPGWYVVKWWLYPWPYSQINSLTNYACLILT